MNKKWIISQVWHDVLFLHFEVSQEKLRGLTPFPLDLYNGKAIISIVPFKMGQIRFPYLPAVPGVSSLWELNLRTYVEVNGVKGVYFFTLDTDSLLGQYIARKFFHLPYHYAQISAKVTPTSYFFKHKRENLSLDLSANLLRDRLSTPFDRWATERYSLFTFDKDFDYQGQVFHQPWDLRKAELLSMNDQFSNQLGELSPGTAESISYCPRLEVRFTPFKKISRRS